MPNDLANILGEAVKVTSLFVFVVKNRHLGFFHTSYSYGRGRHFTLFENGEES